MPISSSGTSLFTPITSNPAPSSGSLFGTSTSNTSTGAAKVPAPSGFASGTSGTSGTSGNSGSLFGTQSSQSTLASTSLQGSSATPGNTALQPAPSSAQPAPSAQAPKSIEENKRSMLYKQRAGRFLDDCKNDLEKQLVSFKNISSKLLNFENDNYLVQNDLIRLNEMINRMRNEQEAINDQLAIIEQEQEGFNGFLDAVNKEIDDKSKNINRFIQEGSLYEEAAKVSRDIGNTEVHLLEVVKNINKNDEEPDLLNYEIEGNLDALFDSLNWIEAKVAAIDAKLVKLQR
jgi:hypothetical protein